MRGDNSDELGTCVSSCADDTDLESLHCGFLVKQSRDQSQANLGTAIVRFSENLLQNRNGAERGAASGFFEAQVLALRVLEALTCAGLPVLLTLFLTRIAGKKACLLQCAPSLGIFEDESTRDAVAQGFSLGAVTTAL